MIHINIKACIVVWPSTTQLQGYQDSPSFYSHKKTIYTLWNLEEGSGCADITTRRFGKTRVSVCNYLFVCVCVCVCLCVLGGLENGGFLYLCHEYLSIVLSNCNLCVKIISVHTLPSMSFLTYLFSYLFIYWFIIIIFFWGGKAWEWVTVSFYESNLCFLAGTCWVKHMQWVMEQERYTMSVVVWLILKKYSWATSQCNIWHYW